MTKYQGGQNPEGVFPKAPTLNHISFYPIHIYLTNYVKELKENSRIRAPLQTFYLKSRSCMIYIKELGFSDTLKI